MPVMGGAAIPAVGILLLLAFAGGKKKKKGVSCKPFVWDQDAVDKAALAGIDAQICDPNELAAAVADVVYPTHPDGETIPWPKEPPWQPPMGDAPTACLWGAIQKRTRELIQASPDCIEAADPREVIKPWVSVSGNPRTESFYPIRKGDTLIDTVRKALGLPRGHALIDDAVRCMTSSGWNATYYGTPWDPSMANFPERYAADIDGELVVIREAFNPKHENALSAMYNGRLPERTIDDTGRRLGGPTAEYYGMPWIPAMRVEDGVLICVDTEPPPDVLEVLE